MVATESVGMTVGEGLRRAREARGFSQGELARKTGISSAQISRLETGDRDDPQLSTISALARVLHFSIDALSRGELFLYTPPPGFEQPTKVATYEFTQPAHVGENEEYVLVPVSRLDALDEKLRELSRRLDDEDAAAAEPSPKPRRRASRSA